MIRFYIKWKLEKKKQRNFTFRIRTNCCLVCTNCQLAHIFYSHFNNIFSPIETKEIIFQCYEMFELRNMSIYLGLNPNSVLRRLRGFRSNIHRNELLSVLVSVKLVVSMTASPNILFYHQKMRQFSKTGIILKIKIKMYT